MKRATAAIAATVGLFVLVQLGALALVQPFMDAGYQTVEDPSDPTNSVVYVGAILVATAFMLVAMKFGVDEVLQGLVIFASVFLAFYVFSVIVPSVVSAWGVNVPAAIAALALGVALLAYPEWYVIDAAGILMGAGAAALFGISFGLLPAILLLVVLAVYDAISVYGTEHMLALASGVMDLKLPVILVVPLSLSYSFIEDEGPESISDDDAEANPEENGPGGPSGDTDAATGDGQEPTVGGNETDSDPPSAESDEASDPLERDAFFIGLGDAVMPSILVASAAFFRPGDVPLLDVPGIALTVPALGAALGTIAGLLVLMWMVLKGRAHAGLPLLNGGAIAGYLLGTVVAGVAVVEALGVAPYL
jgi:presenilin-like A22 family membrane protease